MGTPQRGIPTGYNFRQSHRPINSNYYMKGNTLIVFDFWGAGNMGDDLMMQGFMSALEQSPSVTLGEITCFCAWDIASQRRRFPQLTWIDSKDDSAFQRAVERAEIIIGLGSTAFQLTSGDWFLKFVVRALSLIKPETKVFFINVGAETEILPRAKDFAGVLRRVNHCSTRDAFSQGVLSGLGVKSTSEIHIGGDLANISLPNLVKSVTLGKKKHSLGIVLGHDTLSSQDLDMARKFLEDRPSATRTAFITGDARDGAGFEYHLYKTWTKGWFSTMKRKLSLRRPDYTVCSMEDLVRPFAECETIISSRYHGLLTAAWFGCKVAAIGRGSKVTALAEALNVPVIIPPIKPGDLEGLEKTAVRVAPERLEEMRKAALAGISACFDS
jgi:polysaccharide pyruvyl transferase WcaK-like protein